MLQAWHQPTLLEIKPDIATCEAVTLLCATVADSKMTSWETNEEMGYAVEESYKEVLGA